MEPWILLISQKDVGTLGGLAALARATIVALLLPVVVHAAEVDQFDIDGVRLWMSVKEIGAALLEHFGNTVQVSDEGSRLNFPERNKIANASVRGFEFCCPRQVTLNGLGDQFLARFVCVGTSRGHS